MDETRSKPKPRPPMPRGVRTLLLRLGFLCALLTLWTLVARHAPPALFASPWEVLKAGLALAGEGKLLPAVLASLQVFLLGTLMAAIVGMTIGIAMGLWSWLSDMIDIYVYALAATPRIAFIPLVIMALGLGLQAKVVIVFLGAVMPVILNSFAGVRAASPELIEMARATGAGRGRILRHVILPEATPYLLTGLRVGATIGLINTIVAELYTAIGGLGGLLAIYSSRFRMAEYLAVVVVLALIGVAIAEILRLAERRLLRWRSA